MSERKRVSERDWIHHFLFQFIYLPFGVHKKKHSDPSVASVFVIAINILSQANHEYLAVYCYSFHYYHPLVILSHWTSIDEITVFLIYEQWICLYICICAMWDVRHKHYFIDTINSLERNVNVLFFFSSFWSSSTKHFTLITKQDGTADCFII